jgi:Fe2+ transport system protein FeoA
LNCWVDAGYNQDDEAKSQYGYAFSLGERDACFFGVSRKMKITALSSTEAEYVALCEATREAMWLRRYLMELGFSNGESVTMHEDNEPCIRQVNTGEIPHKVGKHIMPKFHYARDQRAAGLIHVQYIPTDEQLADIFTKPLTYNQFDYLANKMMDFSLDYEEPWVDLADRQEDEVSNLDDDQEEF